MGKFNLILATLIVFALIVGCSKGPVAGTWEGQLILKDIQQNTDTSALRLEINGKNFLSGTLTASEFGWQNISIDDRRSVYASDAKIISIVVPVGGDDAELILNGEVDGNSIKNGSASTAGLRTGTWTGTRK